ncbi:MAG: bifunctional UDP-N-acetylglucosamine diphosphorylase/glucosamine-1-phosphate N-acetyltransferase GlmU, partial [Actinomycetota bacterium]|nr:bifunctional UDP-N-acetylglucosamine diphosphorylase/glucosamine-1-phosphate N-acetyltransferase GlmU [Actinomycetota bacterium]
DGVNKNQTKIGDRVFVGVNTNLIAPITIGEDAYLGAGSVVNKNVPPGKLAVGMPARVIRDAPGKVDERGSGDESRKRRQTEMEG